MFGAKRLALLLLSSLFDKPRLEDFQRTGDAVVVVLSSGNNKGMFGKTRRITLLYDVLVLYELATSESLDSFITSYHSSSCAAQPFCTSIRKR